jgi:hypothetical protein
MKLVRRRIVCLVLRLRFFKTVATAVTTGLVLAMLLSMPATAWAIQVFEAILTGSQETPPNNSPGTGISIVSLNDLQTQLTVSLTFTGLVAPETAAHIHGPAAPGLPAQVLYPLMLVNPDNQVITLINNPNGSGLTIPQQISDLDSGLFYVNVHSTAFPGGEIRGQLSPVPEPATAVLLGAGTLGIGGLMRKRARRPTG